MKNAADIVTDLIDRRVVEEVPETPSTSCNSVIGDQMLVSIAISAKRIADALDRVGSGEGLHGLHGFVTDLAYHAGMNFEGGRKRG